MTVLDFTLPPELEAHEPPEARGLPRDGVRLLVGERATGAVSHHRFTDLPDLLRPGDVLVVNTSGTLPAAVQVDGGALWLHFSTQLPDGDWLVELRRPGAAGKASTRFPGGAVGQSYRLPDGGQARLREPFSEGRLWRAHIDSDRPALEFLARYGEPIRYSYVPRRWGLDNYQTVFASTPGSAEMPSAARPFTDRMVTRLVAAGVLIVPVLLHTGVASPEAHERPYPEWYAVPEHTLRVARQAREAGGRVIAVGTTAVRALESAQQGPLSGWTELIVTGERGVSLVDGLLTGLHEPRASHLDMLDAVAGRELLAACYAQATTEGYLWHEFGDLNLLLP
jgi:S-adenosylmethionine:tRNA ribosyltransferase-isomerase